MSNFKLYLEKAQGKKINFNEIVSLNENFRNYMQKIYQIDEAKVLDFKVVGNDLWFAIDDLEDSAIKDPKNTAEYTKLGPKQDYLDDNNTFTENGIIKLKNHKDFINYDTNKIKKIKVDNTASELNINTISQENILNKKKVLSNLLKGGQSRLAIVQNFRGIFKPGGIKILEDNLAELINQKILILNNELYSYFDKTIIDDKNKDNDKKRMLIVEQILKDCLSALGEELKPKVA